MFLHYNFTTLGHLLNALNCTDIIFYVSISHEYIIRYNYNLSQYAIKIVSIHINHKYAMRLKDMTPNTLNSISFV